MTTACFSSSYLRGAAINLLAARGIRSKITKDRACSCSSENTREDERAGREETKEEREVEEKANGYVAQEGGKEQKGERIEQKRKRERGRGGSWLKGTQFSPRVVKIKGRYISLFLFALFYLYVTR